MLAPRPLNSSQTLGAILVDSGKMTLADAERVLRLQKEQGLLFGDAATALGLISSEDIQFALARQYEYPYLRADDVSVSTEVVAAFQPFSPQVESLRALRSQLMLRWFTGERERRALAVVSPARGEGRSYLAANLAVVFSQLGEHTLLIDADLRNPRQHALFGLKNRCGLSTVLSGRSETNDIQRIPSFKGLSLLSSGPLPPNPQELLGRPAFANLLNELSSDFDVVLIDTPATTEYADARTIAVRASGALMLARTKTSRLAEVRELADQLTQSGVAVVGSVLNEPTQSHEKV